MKNCGQTTLITMFRQATTLSGCFGRDTLWNGRILRIRPLIQWGLPGLFSRVFVTPDEGCTIEGRTWRTKADHRPHGRVFLVELFLGKYWAGAKYSCTRPRNQSHSAGG
jgi:hypothetical protein